MAFQQTSRNVQLRGSTLFAECLNYEGFWKPSNLELNYHIGCTDGRFDVGGYNFAGFASSLAFFPPLLIADLARNDGTYNRAVLNLNLCVQNKDGDLYFQKPNESIINTTSCIMMDGPMLKALCIGYDGMAHFSSISLNDYWTNSNGSFAAGRDFYFTARNIRVQPTSGSVLLQAELKGSHWYSGNFWAHSEVDVSTCILNRGGHFIFEQHDGLFDRDGAFAKFFERAPFVGFIIAGIHALAGDEQYAQRAIAYCANSTTVCLGILIGASIGGPLGGAIGACLMTPLGVLLETKAAGQITDPGLQTQFEEATIGRYLYESLRNTLAAGVAGYFAEWVGHQAGLLTSAAIGEIAGKFGGKSTETVGEFVSYAMLKKLADALKDEVLPIDWVQTENAVIRLKEKSM